MPEQTDKTESLPARERGSGALVCTAANHKGGAGKTATVANVAAVLGASGHRVLVVDLDPQVHISPWFGRPPAAQSRSSGWALMDPNTCLADVIEPAVSKGVDLVPGNRADLTTAASLLTQDPVEGNHRLALALDSVRDAYDVVLIDTPPTVGALTVNGILAADEVLVPLFVADPLAGYGAIEMSRMVAKLADRQGNGRPHLAGILLVRYDPRTVLARAIEADLYEQQLPVFLTRIPQDIKVGESVYEGSPVIAAHPASRAAAAYEALANELLTRSMGRAA